jgi:hypothetical protein
MCVGVGVMHVTILDAVTFGVACFDLTSITHFVYGQFPPVPSLILCQREHLVLLCLWHQTCLTQLSRLVGLMPVYKINGSRTFGLMHSCDQFEVCSCRPAF